MMEFMRRVLFISSGDPHDKVKWCFRNFQIIFVEDVSINVTYNIQES